MITTTARRTPSRLRRLARTGVVAVTTAVLSAGGLSAALLPTASAAPAGQGFTLNAADLAFILKQIKISEQHAATATPANPCGTLVGPGPNQVPDILTSYGLRTVDGSCNNLSPGREVFGTADENFPRLAAPSFPAAEDSTVPGAGPVGPPGNTSYDSTGPSANVVDSQPRLISNLIVDQTSANPAAVEAAGAAVRSQGGDPVVPCGVDGLPAGCVPAGETLFIPNVTTDIGLSPPYNSLFTIFGQFFDHGLDKITNGNAGLVFVPLKDDDPLIAGPDLIPGNADDPQPDDPSFVPANQRFMVLTRGTNQDGPGADGILGTADDTHHEAQNTDSPWVDLSQDYASHSAHQVYLREYAFDGAGRPQATGKFLGSADGTMVRWSGIKQQTAEKLGLLLSDKDVSDVPMIAADPYGNFLPGPNGLAQWVTPDGLVEGDLTTPVPVPANALRVGAAFLNDIAHSAAPKVDGDGLLLPDADTTAGGSLDTPVPTGSYDDELLDLHVIAGDGRANENIGLTAIHTVFEHEHNRLAGYIKALLTSDTSATGVAALAEWKSASQFGGVGLDGWNGARLFQAARFVTEMQYQHLVFEEFGRKVQPAIDPFHLYHTDIDPAISAEFAHAVYRFGHSMLNDTLPRINADGSRNDIELFDGFLNPAAYTDGGSAGQLGVEEATGALIMGLSDQVGNELDEFVADTLRNRLLGLPLDLAALNMTRARSEGIPSLNNLRKQIHAETNNSALIPYTSWADFGQHLKHPASLTNFVAAYGTHPSITGATTLEGRRAAAKLIVDPAIDDTPPADAFDFLFSNGDWADDGTASTTGLDKVDLWVGGLAEVTNPFGGLLGSTFNYVFEKQLTDLQNGDRFYYLARTPGLNLRAQLEGNSFAELAMRNTNAKTLKADAFATADCKFELGSNPGIAGPIVPNSSAVADDPNSECNETALLVRAPDGTISYRARNSVDPAGINGQGVYNGTAGVNKVNGGNDNDTFWGNEGNDRIDGQAGDDIALGGEGNDIITDLAGDDVPKGGPGNDAIDGGIGLDIVMAGDGKDFTNGGDNDNETFAGKGDDFVIAGVGSDAVFGDSEDDWIQGGSGQDLLCGDHCAPFFDDPGQTRPGNDIFVGQVGENDNDAEGGDDLIANYEAIDRNAGAGGFDWVFHQYNPAAGSSDLNFNLLGTPLPVDVNRDRFQEVEAASGYNQNDVLVGDSVVPSAGGGAGASGCNALDAAGVARIAGLSTLVRTFPTTNETIVATSPSGFCPLTGNVWAEGNILVGGDGSDTLEGRGADDILDGDAYLAVRLSVRTDPADAATEIGSTDLMEGLAKTGNFGAGTAGMTLQQAVFAGLVDPGTIVAVRELKYSPVGPGNIDNAVFTGARANYTVTTNVDGTITVTDNVGTDGTDTLSHIECGTFAGVRVAFAAGCNLPPSGGVTIGGAARATEGIGLTFNSTVSDPDGIAAPGVTYVWQSFRPTTVGGTPTWVTVSAAARFVPGNPEVGFPLRVQGMFVDGQGVANTVVSQQTRLVANVNQAATGTPSATPSEPVVGEPVTAGLGTLADPDGLPATFTYQWFAANTAIPGATSATFTPTATQVGQRLSVRLSFTDLHGTAERRTSAQTQPVLVAPVAPGAPTITSTVAVGRDVTVNWNAPATTGGAPISLYTLTAFASADLNTPVQTVTVTAPTTLGTITGLTPGTAYTFRVTATNSAGTGPEASSTATIANVPGAPTIGAATVTGAGSASVTWTAPANGGSPITGYTVSIVDGAGAVIGTRTAAAGAASLAVTGLTAGQSVRFSVAATNLIGTGPDSALSTAVTPPTAPAAPTLGAVTRASGSITVGWTAPAGNGGSPITGYEVRVQTTAGAQVGALRTAGATATSLVITTGLTAGTAYQFQVRAVNLAGAGAYSALSAATTFATVPGAPTSVTAASGSVLVAGNTITANWQPPTSDGGSPVTGYQVITQRYTSTAGTTTQGAAITSAVQPATARSLQVTGLVLFGNYRVTVVAINALGTGPASVRSGNAVAQ